MPCGLQQHARYPIIALMWSLREEPPERTRLTQAVGFDSIGIPHQHLPVPFQAPQPLPLLPRMPAEDELCAERLSIGSLDDRVEQRLRHRERLGANDTPLRAREAGRPQEQVLDLIPLFSERPNPQPRNV
jgi:hypothetical protein